MQRALVLVLLLSVAFAAGAGPAAAGAGGVTAAGGLAPTGHAASHGGECAFPLTRQDATGTAVAVDADPERVVALQPSAAQTMWEIGASGEVVGMPVNQYTAGLEGYQRPRDVVGADGYTVVTEAVVDLEPDLVLAPNVTGADTLATLREAGLTVYHFREARSLEDVVAKTRLTGRLTGNCAGADARARWMEGRLDRVRTAVAGEPRPTVVYPLGGGVVAGSDTFLHELVVAAGGRNAAAAAGVSGYGQLSAEVIVAADPEWLLLNEGLPRSAIQLDAYNRTTAIREGQVVRIDPNHANQPAPRVVFAVEAIARALHPEAMAAAAEGTTTDTPGTTAGSASTTETATGGQPGFGLAAGLVAVLAALAAGTRRRRR